MSAAARATGRPWWSALFVLGACGLDYAVSRAVPAHLDISAWWPGAGLGLLALLVAPTTWWASLAAALYSGFVGAHLLDGVDPGAALGLGAAETLAVLAGGWWLRGVGRVVRIDRLRDVWHVFAAGVVAGAVGGLGVGGVSHLVLGHDLWSSFVLGGLGQTTSVLLLAPLLLLPGRSSWRFGAGTILQLVFQVLAFLAVTLLSSGRTRSWSWRSPRCRS